MEASLTNAVIIASSAVGSGDSSASASVKSSSSSAMNACEPRTCYECVNIAIRSGAKCTVAPNGDCVDEAKAAELYQSQAGSGDIELNSSVTIYSSSANHTYCEQDDAEYLDGISANSSAASPRVCVGSADCACLAVCETFQYASNVTCIAPPSVPTATTAPASPTQTDASQTSESVGGYAWLLVFFALFLLMSVWSYQQTHIYENGAIVTSYRERFRGKKRAPPRGPFLSLSGWLGYREKLIEEERAAMTDGKPSTLKKTLTQNGPDVTVQMGEGYRPASPSHVNR